MGQAIQTLFQSLADQAVMPERTIATAMVVIIGIGLTMMPYEHGVVKFVKDNALRVAVGLAIALNAPAIVATMAGG